MLTNWKEEAPACALLRTRFGRGSGPVGNTDYGTNLGVLP